jgi:hypothetical protein
MAREALALWETKQIKIRILSATETILQTQCFSGKAVSSIKRGIPARCGFWLRVLVTSTNPYMPIPINHSDLMV